LPLSRYDVSTVMAFDILQSKYRKLQQLHELLNDPEIAPEVRALFVHRNGISAPQQAELPLTKKTGKRKSRNPKMLREALKVVLESSIPVSARHVADHMEKHGFRFTTKDKNLAVSKVLRRIASQGAIEARPGLTPKAPIMYLRCSQQ
jgi:hypothetical protein